MARHRIALTSGSLLMAAVLAPAAAQAADPYEVDHVISFAEPTDDGQIQFFIEAQGWMGPAVSGDMPNYSITAKKPGENHYHHTISAPSEELVCVAGADPSEFTVHTPFAEDSTLTTEYDGLYVIAEYCTGGEKAEEVLGVFARGEDGTWTATDGPIDVEPWDDGRGDGDGPIVDTGTVSSPETPWQAALAGAGLLAAGGLLLGRRAAGGRG